MSYMEFESLDEMVAWQQQQTASANANLAPEQAAITWGDHWVRFDPASMTVIFGTIWELSYWDGKIAEAEPGEDRDEWVWEKDSVIASHVNGYLFGRAYSIIEPDGELGSTHRANMWPITPECFEAAEQAGWRLNDIKAPYENELRAAYDGWRAAQLAWGRNQ